MRQYLTAQNVRTNKWSWLCDENTHRLVSLWRFFPFMAVRQLLHLHHFNPLCRRPGKQHLPVNDFLYRHRKMSDQRDLWMQKCGSD